MARMTLAIHPQLFTIHSLAPDSIVPSAIFQQDIYFIGKTSEELSVVVISTFEMESLEQENGWRCLEVLGPLGFSMTGILSSVSGALAAEKISIFAISTFDTDYILVKKDTLAEATKALKKKNYQIIEHQSR
ncbi:ACT domain-containing protein [Shewanella sp. Choline-02u-19]|uniref:ACT domain-containing protein n=1 Tax=unclassified Shewanella TaxID=196818 RepID=UPI000C34B8DF|nr:MULTISPECIES: ACT domain-containing protein [unclassified Shewanella]PKG73809.1 ACT domain-containing protein [Shewanella sp. GutCb]PKH56840.1 ACT domain-containing protein [Shewanella sp. Bg11-22]PKI27637.1 ACT domain-containing protein [Shewanella sp. Choline-02u-19]